MRRAMTPICAVTLAVPWSGPRGPYNVDNSLTFFIIILFNPSSTIYTAVYEDDWPNVMSTTIPPKLARKASAVSSSSTVGTQPFSTRPGYCFIIIYYFRFVTENEEEFKWIADEMKTILYDAGWWWRKPWELKQIEHQVLGLKITRKCAR